MVVNATGRAGAWEMPEGRAEPAEPAGLAPSVDAGLDALFGLAGTGIAEPETTCGEDAIGTGTGTPYAPDC